jgi:SAM-dependent methyltransferase
LSSFRAVGRERAPDGVAGARLLAPERYDDLWRRDNVDRGLLPLRYLEPWAERFEELLPATLDSGLEVLDVGSGRSPVLSPATRSKLTYVGLDVSRLELEQAPSDAYDEIEVANLAEFVPGLERRFDLVLSWQVLEHVDRLDLAFENLGRYLRPRGVLVALFSGRYSPMALLNRAMPHRLAKAINQRLVGRDPDSMFHTEYDFCYASAIRRLLSDWDHVDLEPRWHAANYFAFARPVLRAYVALETRLAAGGWEDLATHYFLRAVR